MICNWNRQYNQIKKAVTAAAKPGIKVTGRPGLLRVRYARKGRYAAAEAEVYAEFLQMRAQGHAIHGCWFRQRMKLAVTALYGQDQAFKGSKTWLKLFCQRYDLAYRAKKNKKSVPIEEKVQLLRRFFARLRFRLSRGKVLCKKYGRWLAGVRLCADQVPMPLMSPNSHTYATGGSKEVWVRGCNEDAEKCLRTFMLMHVMVNGRKNAMFAKQPRPVVVFRNLPSFKGNIANKENEKWTNASVFTSRRRPGSTMTCAARGARTK